MNETKKLISNVKRLRKNLGMTGEALAELAGVSYSYLRKFESGQVPPSYNLITDISAALGVSIADLFRDEPPRKPLKTSENLQQIFHTLAEHSELIELMSHVPKDDVTFDIIKRVLEDAAREQIEKKNRA